MLSLVARLLLHSSVGLKTRDRHLLQYLVLPAGCSTGTRQSERLGHGYVRVIVHQSDIMMPISLVFDSNQHCVVV